MRSIVLGTAGHIDHGKSALVKALTGTDPDRLKEERERGITIDLGFAHTVIGDVDVGFVDVPGHERFVRNMLAGAGGIDGVVLVVAADSSVMPQTREHFDICRLLGVERGVIALTKSDLVDRDALALVELEVRELVASSFLADAPVVPVSVRTGAGLEALRSALVDLARPAARRARAGVVRLPIDRVFVMKGFGTVVTGTLVSGRVREGGELIVLPEGRPVRVRGVQVHGAAMAEVAAPRRVAVNLGAIDSADLVRGVTLATPGMLAVTRRFDARVQLLASARPCKHGARVRVHNSTSDVGGRIAISAVRAGPTDDWQPAQPGHAVAVPPGGDAYVRVRLEHPMVMTRGDRVVLRAYSPAATIGGGVVLDPEPPAGGLRRPGALERFQMSDSDGAPELQLRWQPEMWLRDYGVLGLEAVDLVRRGGLDPEAADAVVEHWIVSGRAMHAGSRVFATAAVQSVESRILERLPQFHQDHPLEVGMPRETLRELAAARAPHELFDAVLASMTTRALIKGTDRIALPSHRELVSDEERRDKAHIEQLFRAAGLTPPDLTQVQKSSGLAQSTLNGLVHLLVRDGRLVRVDTLLFHVDALNELRRQVRLLKPADVDIATFKERHGLSRKYAIPLLEWLDKERVTRRVGERRVIL